MYASDSSNAAQEDNLTMNYKNGLPVIVVPLPSRKELCQFTLRPVSNTVSDLCQNIIKEDRGIDIVHVYTSGKFSFVSWPRNLVFFCFFFFVRQ